MVQPKLPELLIAIMDGSQLAVSIVAFNRGAGFGAAIISLLLLPQIWFQFYFVKKPLALTVWYQARAQNFLVLGMLVAAWIAF